MAYPLVLLPVLLLTHENTAQTWGLWLGKTVLWEVLGGIIVGAAVGWVVAKGYRRAQAHGWSGGEDVIATTLALTLLTLGGLKLIHTDGLLGVFVAALVFGRMTGQAVEKQEEVVQVTVTHLLQPPVFLLFGLMLPWDRWAAWGWTGVLFALLVVLLRRPILIGLLKPLLAPVKRWDEAAFVGWFGPIGVAALFYATLAERKAHSPWVWELVSLVVLVSVVLHGLTSYPLTLLLSRREPDDEKEPPEEAGDEAPAKGSGNS